MKTVTSPQFVSRVDDERDYSSCLIATLGPAGTSSEFAARHISDNVVLFESYELAARKVLDNPANSLLLVANAYQKINHFYISRNCRPATAFFLDTPPYVLASKTGLMPSLSDELRIATHAAPAHILATILPHIFYKTVETASTSRAAEITAAGETELCLTTLPACLENQLSPIIVAGPIPMLWTIFSPKGVTDYA